MSKKPYRTLILFTNRNALVFDQTGNRVPKAQAAITCYGIDYLAAQQVIDNTEQFRIARWRDWIEVLTKREMEYLLGLRTVERDIDEQKENPYPRAVLIDKRTGKEVT